jgi:hypothetical protein
MRPNNSWILMVSKNLKLQVMVIQTQRWNINKMATKLKMRRLNLMITRRTPNYKKTWRLTAAF